MKAERGTLDIVFANVQKALPLMGQGGSEPIRRRIPNGDL